MKAVSIQEAKTHFSQLLAHMQEDASVLVCKRGVPVAEIRLLPKRRKEPRPIGLGAGTAKILPAFFDPMPDSEIETFYNPKVKTS